MPRSDSSFRVLEQMGANNYRIELPEDMGNIIATFNVGDLTPYTSDDIEESIENESSKGEKDEARAPSLVQASYCTKRSLMS